MEGKIKFRILVDRTTLELFANDDQVYMPIRTHVNIIEISEFFPYKLNYAVPYAKPIIIGKSDIIVFSEGGITKLVNMEVHELNSIWH